VDWDATGLLDGAPDPAVRRALLDHLHERGHSVELMQDAHRIGRLYALSGDQLMRPGRLTVTLAQLAERLGADLDWTRRVWRALGLTEPAGDEPVLTADEAGAFAIWSTVRAVLGDSVTVSLARVHGASLARMTEAVNAAMSAAVPEIDLVHGGDELSVATTFEQVAAMVPQVAAVLDVLYRQHLGEATRYFEAAHAPGGFGAGPVPYCVAFADLCGFSAATERLSMSELTEVLAEFEAAAYDEAASAGGRCVKLIGDAAMLVAASADALTDMTHRLVTRMDEQSGLLPVRVGMAAGDVVFRDGDYFGAPVNLAARLLALAAPGDVLADEALAHRLDPAQWRIEAREPQEVKGFRAPVAPQLVTRRGVS
jgi:class 3 adenylate cyclase